jgi:hypothetical protein
MALPRKRILRGLGLTLFVLIALAGSASCATATGPADKKVAENMPDPRALDGRRAALPDGQYTCTIQEGKFKYPSFPCVIATSGGKVRLERVDNVAQMHGTLTMTEAGFQFEGELACMNEDCTRPVVAEFHRTDDQRHYVGEIHTRKGWIRFDLRYRPGGAAAYSGAGETYQAPVSEPIESKPVRQH